MVCFLPPAPFATNQNQLLSLQANSSHTWSPPRLDPLPSPLQSLHGTTHNHSKTSRSKISPIRRRHPTLLQHQISQRILHLNVTLNKIQSWFKANHLKLNPDKTELILFASKSNHLPIQEWLKNLDALNCSLALSDSVKSLGITLDKYLSMRDHIKNSTKSVLYALKQLKKMKPFIPQDDLKTIVQSLVLSKLDYGNAILTGTPKTHLAPLRSVLNMAARLITGAKRYDHITPALRSLNWLPMEGRCIYKLACITHKTLHSQSPNYLNNKLFKAGTARSLRSSNSLLLIPPKLKKKTTQARPSLVAYPGYGTPSRPTSGAIPPYPASKGTWNSFSSRNTLSPKMTNLDLINLADSQLTCPPLIGWILICFNPPISPLPFIIYLIFIVLPISAWCVMYVQL